MSIKSIIDQLFGKKDSENMTDTTETMDQPMQAAAMPAGTPAPLEPMTRPASAPAAAQQQEQRHLDFSKLEKLTLDTVKGKLSPIETSEYNNLLGQINGELNTGASKEEIEKFKQRVEALHVRLN